MPSEEKKYYGFLLSERQNGSDGSNGSGRIGKWREKSQSDPPFLDISKKYENWLIRKAIRYFRAADRYFMHMPWVRDATVLASPYVAAVHRNRIGSAQVQVPICFRTRSRVHSSAENLSRSG